MINPVTKNPATTLAVGVIRGPCPRRRSQRNELTNSAVPKTAGMTVEKAREASVFDRTYGTIVDVDPVLSPFVDQLEEPPGRD
jgi:hypothetical protein